MKERTFVKIFFKKRTYTLISPLIIGCLLFLFGSSPTRLGPMSKAPSPENKKAHKPFPCHQNEQKNPSYQLLLNPISLQDLSLILRNWYYSLLPIIPLYVYI